MPRYGLPLHELPHRALDAVDAAERGQGRTVLLRDGSPVAALVSMDDLDRADPPDPGLGGGDPLLALCGTCTKDWFVEQVLLVYGGPGAPPTSSPSPSAPVPPPVPSSGRDSGPVRLDRTHFDAPLPPRPRR